MRGNCGAIKGNRKLPPPRQLEIDIVEKLSRAVMVGITIRIITEEIPDFL